MPDTIFANNLQMLKWKEQFLAITMDDIPLLKLLFTGNDAWSQHGSKKGKASGGGENRNLTSMSMRRPGRGLMGRSMPTSRPGSVPPPPRGRPRPRRRQEPGRSDNDVKNRWYASLRKRVDEDGDPSILLPKKKRAKDKKKKSTTGAKRKRKTNSCFVFCII